MTVVTPDETPSPRCPHCKFGLIVTGDGEREFLPELFSTLTKYAGCSFQVITQIDQRGPVTEQRRLKMVGSGRVILDKDETEIGLKARGFLKGNPCHFLILIDDVEHDRRPHLTAIRDRYRKAIDTMLSVEEQLRASVHFLANMVEAYYFSHNVAVNDAMGITLLATDHNGDVETIRHPKNELKNLAKRLGRSFDEKQDGRKIISKLDVEHILSNKESCAFLRSLFVWCVKQLTKNCPIWDQGIASKYCLIEGIQAEITQRQT